MIQAEIDRLTRTLSISLAIGLLALYVVMLPLMIGVTRTLRRQNNQLQDQADQLSDLLEREQDTVAELRELDRMKSDFVAATSHELRTPLTSINGYVHILRGSSLADDPVAVEALGAIERQSSRLFRLIANVLRESNLEHDDTQNAVFMFPFRIWSTKWWPTSTTPASASSARSPRISAGHRRSPPGPGRPREPRRQRAEVLGPRRRASRWEPANDGSTFTFWVSDQGVGIEPGDSLGSSSASTRWTSRRRGRYGGVGWACTSSRACSRRSAGASRCRARRATAARSR